MSGSNTALGRAARTIDSQIGERVRNRRVALGMTQSELAEKLDLSYQQLQKYETAHNRISAGRLWQIAKILQVEPSYFFEGVDDTAGFAGLEHGGSRRPALELVKNFEKIQDQELRDSASALIKAISGGRKGESL